jgi:D-xylose 1-dehydrogenase (NADP+, D-xylono-1,5-lactone-forming)
VCYNAAMPIDSNQEKSVNWGVLGCARVFERRMAPGFALAKNANLLAIASRSLEKAQLTAQKHGIEKYYGSYEELLTDATIDAVFIPLPNSEHFAWAKKALIAGKHVLCDKPLTMTHSEAVELSRLANTQNLRLMEGFMYRHHPQHAIVHQAITDGRIGTLQHFRGVFAYSATPDPTNIRWKKEMGGGVLLDVGVYPVNAARWFFGEEPLAVYATGGESDTVDTQISVVLEFSGGRTATIQASFHQAFCSQYELMGSLGTIIVERSFQVGEKGVSVLLRPDNEAEEILATFLHIDHYAEEIAHFSACVLDPTLPLAPGEDGVAQARVVEALRYSQETQLRVRLL